MTRRLLRVLTLAVAAALIALMLYAGEPSRLSWWLLALPFGAWIVGPAAVPYLLARWVRHAWFVHGMLAFLALSSAWSATIYYQAFFVSRSSTAALVMIFVPLYQWAALACIGLLSIVIGRRLKRRHPRA